MPHAIRKRVHRDGERDLASSKRSLVNRDRVHGDGRMVRVDSGKDRGDSDRRLINDGKDLVISTKVPAPSDWHPALGNVECSHARSTPFQPARTVLRPDVAFRPADDGAGRTDPLGDPPGTGFASSETGQSVLVDNFSLAVRDLAHAPTTSQPRHPSNT